MALNNHHRISTYYLKVLINGLLMLLIGQVQAQNVPDKIASIDAPFEMPDLQRTVFQKKDFNITAYGAEEGGKKLNKTAFKNAIEACNEAGGGRVIVPAGKWLTVPIVLKSNVNLFLSKGAEVYITSNKQYFFRDEESRRKGDLTNPKYPITADHCENIAITGSGTIDANGLGWWPLHPRWWPMNKDFFENSIYEKAWEGVDKKSLPIRPQMFRPFYCNNVLLEGVTFSNSPFWTINPVACKNVIIRGVTIKARASEEHFDTPNTDGINPESCKNVLVEYCHILTGDDSFAIKSGKDEQGRERGIPSENIVIRHCYGRNIAIGSEMSGGVRNIFIHDISLKGSPGEAIHIKTRRGRGGIVENIWVQDIDMLINSKTVLRVDMEYWTHVVPAPYEPVSERTPKFRNLFFKNIHSTNRESQTAIVLNGLPEMPIENARFENIQIASKEGIICNNTRGASFNDIKLTGLRSNPVSIDNSQDISLMDVKFDNVSGPSIVVKGEGTEHIVLEKFWEKRKNEILIIDGAIKQAVQFEDTNQCKRK